jgi:hypothetical protein
MRLSWGYCLPGLKLWDERSMLLRRRRPNLTRTHEWPVEPNNWRPGPCKIILTPLQNLGGRTSFFNANVNEQLRVWAHQNPGVLGAYEISFHVWHHLKSKPISHFRLRKTQGRKSDWQHPEEVAEWLWSSDGYASRRCGGPVLPLLFINIHKLVYMI